jgi:hypothetical protein
VPPERRRRATRRETRGFEWIKIHSITARHRIAVSAIVAARPSRRACLLHPPSREKMKPEKRIARVNRIVVVVRRTCRVARHRRKSTSCPNQCQRRVRQLYSCLCSCVSSQRMCVVICRVHSWAFAPQLLRDETLERDSTSREP